MLIGREKSLGELRVERKMYREGGERKVCGEGEKRRVCCK